MLLKPEIRSPQICFKTILQLMCSSLIFCEISSSACARCGQGSVVRERNNFC